MAILLLQHEHAQEFFERALHPDREELRERDEYFARLSEMFRSVTDTDEMEFEIPDIDVAGLLGRKNRYMSAVSDWTNYFLSWDFDAGFSGTKPHFDDTYGYDFADSAA